MSVSFDFNFWTLLFVLMNFMMAIYSVNSTKSRASAEKLEQVNLLLKSEIHTLREQHNQTASRFGERIQALETNVENQINRHDIESVHRRVDEMHSIMAEVQSTIGHVKGMLEGWQRASLK